MNLTDGRTFRELDEALGMPKGSAFRCFKKHLSALVENHDFQVLYAEHDEQVIFELKQAGRAYAQSHNLVLLSPITFDLLARYMRQQSG